MAKRRAIAAASSVRIIGGQWRGRKLPVAEANGLRPTADRIRETLFNWLAPDLPGARCLDLFAGTGALGLEALSRGAEAVTFVEPGPEAADQLAANLTLLEATGGTLFRGRAADYLNHPDASTVDIVFVDPPFDLDLWHSSLSALEDTGLLHGDSLLYLEHPKNRTVQPPAPWRNHRAKNAGQVAYSLWVRD